MNSVQECEITFTLFKNGVWFQVLQKKKNKKKDEAQELFIVSTYNLLWSYACNVGISNKIQQSYFYVL